MSDPKVLIIDDAGGEGSPFSKGEPQLLVAIIVFAIAAIPPYGPDNVTVAVIGVLSCLMGLISMALVRRVRLEIYEDRLEFGYGDWPLTKLNRLIIPLENIISIHPVDDSPFVDLPMPWPNRGFHSPVKGKDDYADWLGVFADYRNRKALAVETLDGNWMIGCKDPEEVANLIRRAAEARKKT